MRAALTSRWVSSSCGSVITVAGGPCSTTRPASITRTWSATAATRPRSWPIQISAVPRSFSSVSSSTTSVVPRSSRAVVISSQISTSGCARTALARAARCSSPPDSRLGGRAAVIAATPRRARVRDRFGVGVLGRRPRRRCAVRATCWSTGRRSSNEPRTSCQTYWIRRFCSRDRLRRTGSASPSRRIRPVKRSCRPARQRASVVLPLPERPTTPTQSPARTARSTSCRMGSRPRGRSDADRFIACSNGWPGLGVPSDCSSSVADSTSGTA